jgi:hypothetical protein
MASDFQRRRARLFTRLFTLIGSIFVTGTVVGAAAIVAQMSGCCGGAPTHGCKFIDPPKDAAMDVSSDAALPCGLQICQPGVTNCCVEPGSADPIRCIPVGQLCKGPSGNCAGNADCPVGSGQVCCGTIQTMSVQCQDPATCPGDLTSTARICRSAMDCPPNLPYCAQFTLNLTLVINACSSTP